MSRLNPRLQLLRTLLPEPLGSILEPSARLVTLRQGQIIVQHQERGTDVFVILEGRVRVELQSLRGREIILADIGPGDIFGEYAAIDGLPRSASIEATAACTLASIPGSLFADTVFSDPALAQWLARRLVGRIRDLTERIFELNALAVRSRLHCELLRLSLAAGIRDNTATIAPAPTHAQLASRISTHREAVTREIQYLAKQGIVEQDGRRLKINDVAELAEIVRAAAGDVDLLERAGLSVSNS